MILYWTGATGNTRRFVEKLSLDSQVLNKDSVIESDYVLVVPTYGVNAEVPGPVRSFLNHRPNRKYIVGVVATGNRNFGPDFANAGRIIAKKLKVPLIAEVELAGTEEDMEKVTSWYKQHMNKEAT